MSWADCKLGDVVTLQRGHDLPSDKRLDGDVPVVSSSGITGSHNEAKAQPPGVVTGRYGTIGEVFYVTEPYWPLNTALYAIDFHGNDPRFVSYFLRNALRDYKSDKAAVPGVDRKVLHALPAKCPDVPTQERIAEILSSYDDLISHNEQRISILEKSVRLLFEKWFVILRYPKCEGVEAVSSPPEGWRLSTAFDAFEILSGGTPKTSISAYWGGDIPFFTPKDVVEDAWVSETERQITESGLRNCNSDIFDKGTVFITARGTVGNLNLALRPMAMSQSCYALIGKTYISQYFVYLSTLNSISRIRQQAGGAVFDAIIIDTFKRIPILIPSEEVMVAFTDAVSPYFDLIAALHLQIKALRKARDHLSPRLLDGRIAV
jgi:type I restriction enzyme S subunit